MDVFEIDSYITKVMSEESNNLMSTLIYYLYMEARNKLFKERQPSFREYMDIVRMYVPCEIYYSLPVEQKNYVQHGHFCENCENSDDFIREDNKVICQRCFMCIVQYKNYFEGYDPRYGCTVLLDNVSKHFRNLITKYEYKYSWDIISIDDKLLNDFHVFRQAYHELNLDRKNFISHELVLYVILKRHNIKCHISDFDSLKKCHIGICTKVLEKLNWDNYFLPYNKQTMDQLEKYTNEFLDNIRSLINEGCQIDIELLKIKIHEVINPHLAEDTCDLQVNRCIYVLKKGDKKGQECGKRCKSNFCAKHSKRMSKETEEN